MKVLIAYDGSESADTAIDGLRRAGVPREADALVASVAEVWLPAPEHEATIKDTRGYVVDNITLLMWPSQLCGAE